MALADEPLAFGGGGAGGDQPLAERAEAGGLDRAGGGAGDGTDRGACNIRLRRSQTNTAHIPPCEHLIFFNPARKDGKIKHVIQKIAPPD
jgi:hypothetical protein